MEIGSINLFLVAELAPVVSLPSSSAVGNLPTKNEVLSVNLTV